MATSTSDFNPCPRQSTHNSPKPHVVVIGGGITGTVTALELSLAGFSVTLIEKGDLGHGASCRSVAACRQQFSTELSVRGMRYAIRYLREFAEHYGCEPVYFPRGYLFLYRDPKQFDDACFLNENQQGWGLTDATVLTPEQVLRQFPYVGDSLVGATWCPSDGFMSPDTIYREAADHAQNHGACVMKNYEVVGVKKLGDRITHVVARKVNWNVADNVIVGYGERTEIPADMVVNATGIWAPRNASNVLDCTSVPITPEQVFVYMLKKGAEHDISRWPFIVAGDNGAYCRPNLLGNEVILGWTKRTIQIGEIFLDADQDNVPPGFHYRDSNGYAEEMWTELTTWVPALGEMGLANMGRGVYDVTPDNNPVIDYDRSVPNLVHAIGFSGHGAMYAPFTALVVKHLLEQGPSWTMAINGATVDLGAFSIERELRHGAEKHVL